MGRLMINIHWLSLHESTPPRHFWDQYWIELLATGEIWQVPFHPVFTHTEGPEVPTNLPGSILVIPGRTHYNDIGAINQIISQLNWVVVIVSGDEESRFPVDKLDHPNIRIWTQTPNHNHPPPGHYIGDFYPPDLHTYLRDHYIQALHRPLDWFFSGQITHQERRECRDALLPLRHRGVLVETPGFTLGLPYPEYVSHAVSSKVIPCPSGPFTPDTFRLFESLESGCIPVTLDHPYWRLLLGESPPWPTISHWGQFTNQYLTDILANYPSNANRIFSWWQCYKRDITYKFIQSIIQVRGSLMSDHPTPSDLITVLIPTSPVPSHPSPEHTIATIDSVRAQLPTAEIILMIDGVRDEQSERYEDYQEYIRRLLWVINTSYHNIAPVIFTDHLHQAEMTRRTLPTLHTPLLLYVEHDTPLTGQIDWSACTGAIVDGWANTIRFHHEASILPPHEHLMLDHSPTDIHGATFLRTVQWSQRPHLSSVSYYTWLINEFFTADSRTYIEDVVYSPIVSAWHDEGFSGWERHKLWMYAPQNESMKRSEHSDARSTDPKYSITP